MRRCTLLMIYYKIIDLLVTKAIPDLPSAKYPIEIVYANLNENCQINFENDWKIADGNLVFNMKLEYSDFSPIAQIDEKGTHLINNPYILYISNLTSTTLDFKPTPIYFDNSEVYLLLKMKISNNKFKYAIIKKYIIRVISTPNITCECPPNYFNLKYECHCVVFSRPLVNVSIFSNGNIEYYMNVNSKINEFDYHMFIANITFFNIYEDQDIQLCFNNDHILKDKSCFIFKALRFPRRFSDFFALYIALPLFLLTALPLSAYLIVRIFRCLIIKRKKKYQIILNSPEDNLYEKEDFNVSNINRNEARKSNLDNKNKRYIFSLLDEEIPEENLTGSAFMLSHV